MPVKEADPSAVALDAAFAEAMGTPGMPREPGPPPEVDNDAPHGRDEDGTPLAPYGLTKAGKPKRSPAGRRPAGEDKARVAPDDAQGAAEAPKGKQADAEPAEGKWAPAIADTLEVVWLGGSVIGQVGPELPVIGKIVAKTIPCVPLQAQAALILTFKDTLAGAVDLCAQHNAKARRLAEKLASGNVGWAMTAMFMTLPFISTSLQVWGKEERKFDEDGDPLPTLAEQLAESNQQAVREWMDNLAKQAQGAAREQLAEAA